MNNYYYVAGLGILIIGYLVGYLKAKKEAADEQNRIQQQKAWMESLKGGQNG